MGPNQLKCQNQLQVTKYSVFIVLGIYNCLFLLEKPEKGGSSTRRHDEGLLYDNAALENHGYLVNGLVGSQPYFFGLLVTFYTANFFRGLRGLQVFPAISMEKGCKNHRETLYSSKGKIVYVVGKPCNIYRLQGNPRVSQGFPTTYTIIFFDFEMMQYMDHPLQDICLPFWNMIS